MFALLPFDHPFRESEFGQPFGKSDFVARVFDLAGHGSNPGRVLYVPWTVMLTFFDFSPMDSHLSSSSGFQRNRQDRECGTPPPFSGSRRNV